jgi:hypothetical protein
MEDFLANYPAINYAVDPGLLTKCAQEVDIEEDADPVSFYDPSSSQASVMTISIRL